MAPSSNALAATDELERTLGGTGWPNSLKHQIAYIIDRHFRTVKRDALEHAASLYVKDGNPEIFRNRIIKAIETL